MSNNTIIIGLTGSHCTGKTFIVNKMLQDKDIKVYIVKENMDLVLGILGYKNVTEVKPENRWLVQDLLLTYHYIELAKAQALCYQYIVCDRTIFDIAAYTIYYNEYIPDIFIEKVLWYCKNKAPYTELLYFPIKDMDAINDGFRKLHGRQSIDIILKGLLLECDITHHIIASCLADRYAQIFSLFKQNDK